MPLEKDRKKLMKNIELFANILNRYEIKADRKILAQYYQNNTDRKKKTDQKWNFKRYNNVIEML
jgi:hypothetical protein